MIKWKLEIPFGSEPKGSLFETDKDGDVFITGATSKGLGVYLDPSKLPGIFSQVKTRKVKQARLVFDRRVKCGDIVNPHEYFRTADSGDYYVWYTATGRRAHADKDVYRLLEEEIEVIDNDKL